LPPRSWSQKILESLVRVGENYSLDCRSLAFLRIVVGLGFAIVRLINWPNVIEFYTDQGAYSRLNSVILGAQPQALDLFDAVGTPAAVYILYTVTIFVGLSLAAGYRTRLSTLACWVLGLSLLNRCPSVNPASDAEILLCLFFGFFLPWSEIWSLDARSVEKGHAPCVSGAALAWRVQVSAIYITASLAKTSFHWANGTAVLVALISDQWASPLGRWLGALLAPHPLVTSDLTNLVVHLEFILPLLLLCPLRWMQNVGCLGLVFMHAGFGLCLHLEAFSPLAIACLAGFIPAALWQRVPLLQLRLNRLFRALGRATGADKARLRPPSLLRLGPLQSALLTWSILGVLWSCAASVGQAPITLSYLAAQPWQVLFLKESWGMFVPVPFQGGWSIFRGRTEQGDWVNLESSGSVDTLEMPARLELALPGSRQVLLYNADLVASDKLLGIQKKMADNFRIRWERSHPGATSRLTRIEIYKFYREYDSEKGTHTKPEIRFRYVWPPDPPSTSLLLAPKKKFDTGT
jgi:hypothetical protein